MASTEWLFFPLFSGRIEIWECWLLFRELGNPENPEKNLSEQGREPTTNLNPHMSRPSPGIDPGNIGGGGRGVNDLTTSPSLLPKEDNYAYYE